MKHLLTFAALSLACTAPSSPPKEPAAPPASDVAASAPASLAASAPVVPAVPAPAALDPSHPCAKADGPKEENRGKDRLDEYAKEILPMLESLRGAAAISQVKMDFISKRDACLYFVDEISRQSTPEQLRGQEESAKVWGLLPPELGMLDILYPLLTEQVGGFYDPRRDVLFVADFLPRFVQKPILAHEMYHAVQDQRRDLAADLFGESNDDAKTAHSALFEGDGTLVMMLASGSPLQGVITAKGMMASMMRAGSPGMPAFTAAPKAIQESLLFPYASGFLFVMHAAEKGGLALIDDAYRVLPASTEQILHPERYFDARDLPSTVALPASLPVPAGWTQVYENVNGELSLRMAIAKGDPNAKEAAAATGWDGDIYRTYVKETGERAVVSLFVWDDPASAKVFREALVKALPGAVAEKTPTSFAYARGFGADDAAIAKAASAGLVSVVR